jgi:hypothetical protein
MRGRRVELLQKAHAWWDAKAEYVLLMSLTEACQHLRLLTKKGNLSGGIAALRRSEHFDIPTNVLGHIVGGLHVRESVRRSRWKRCTQLFRQEATTSLPASPTQNGAC